MTIEQYRVKFPDARMAFHPASQKEKIRANSARSEKIRLKKIEYWNQNRGKTLEELREVEAARRTKQLLSEKFSGENNPAFGKVYTNAGGRNVGWYKGFLFRSLYEYSFMKFMESSGLELGKNVKSAEEKSIRFEFEGSSRTYHPDFEVDGLGIIEIKSTYELTKGRLKPLNDAKIAAANSHFSMLGIQYRVLTEKDFPVFTKSQAMLDSHIKWIRK